MLYHVPGDALHSISVAVVPDAAGVPRLRVSRPQDELSPDDLLDPAIDHMRDVDADAEPETHAAAAALMNASAVLPTR